MAFSQLKADLHEPAGVHQCFHFALPGFALSDRKSCSVSSVQRYHRASGRGKPEYFNSNHIFSLAIH